MRLLVSAWRPWQQVAAFHVLAAAALAGVIAGDLVGGGWFESSWVAVGGGVPYILLGEMRGSKARNA